VRLLLDTHIAIWLIRDAPELTPRARQLILDAEAVHVSGASLWEATIKVGLGKLPLDPQRLAEQLLRAGIRPLDVTWQHALAVHRLPPLHKDPFDRMLIAQALAEPLHLLTHDAALAPYSDLVILV
jgi:PIN domain nuclease of toxin-antitoxin system